MEKLVVEITVIRSDPNDSRPVTAEESAFVLDSLMNRYEEEIAVAFKDGIRRYYIAGGIANPSK